MERAIKNELAYVNEKLKSNSLLIIERLFFERRRKTLLDALEKIIFN
jgi:hypothetical protein